MPLLAAVSLIGALVFGVLTIAVPLVLKFLTAPLLIAALSVAFLAFWKGDDLPWLSVMLQARREDGRVTSEVVESKE